MFSASQADIFLHHIAMESSDPERLAKFYHSVMDMPDITSDGTTWRCEGSGRRIIIVPGQNKGFAYAGFTCRNNDALELLREHLSEVGVLTHPADNPFFDDTAFAIQDPDGNKICFGTAASESATSGRLIGPVQHLTFASLDVEAFQEFYAGKLGFDVTDRVLHTDGSLATCFTTANHEHHTIACFKSDRQGVDHHSYEAGEWSYIRDWCDHFAAHDIQLMWGPGRHGPGNNLFIFIEDPDGNWIEVSAELETIRGRPVKEWPQSERTLNLWGKAIMRS